MKKLLTAILGIFFLSLISVVSAGYPCDWDTYGSDYILMPNYQYYSGCTSLFNQTNISTLSYSDGQNYNNTRTNYQPLVAGLGQSDEPLLIFPNGNYLQLYDRNMDLVTEILIGQEANSQIDVGDLDGDGAVDDIAGIFEINSTYYAFKIYTYDPALYSLTLQKQIIFSDNHTDFGTNGVRCISGSGGNYGYCDSIWYFSNGTTYTYNFIRFYGNETSLSFQIGSAFEYYSYPREPLSWADWDNDGVNEYLVWSDKNVLVFDGNTGAEELLINASPSNIYERIKQAKFYVPLTPTSPSWFEELFGLTSSNQRIFYTMEKGNTLGCGGGTYYGLSINSIKPDGTTAWSDCYGTTGSGDTMRNYGFAIADYNGDGKDDVWLSYGQSGSNPRNNFKIFKGDDGSSLFSTHYSPASNYAGGYPNTNLFLFRADNDAIPDFASYTPSRIVVYSPALNQTLFAVNNSITSCIPADLTYDGLQDIVCTSSVNTTMYTPLYDNQAPQLISVTYDPSTIVQANATLYMIISANDTEADILLYAHKCYTADSWHESGSPTQSCVYTEVGEYNNTIGVRDIAHPDNYSVFSQNIIVTSSGSLCNNNAVCEAELGENYGNCPSDCEIPETPTPNYTQAQGGMTIPVELVSTENINEGLLPEVYFGVLGFLSNTLSPMMVLIFVVFFVLIILAIGGIIKKIGNSVIR
jgi:hypothetical protein